MKFILNMYGDETSVAEATPEQIAEDREQMGKYNDELRDAGVYVSADGLGPSSSARTLRFGEDGKVVATDGPFAETKEQVAGFWILETKGLDEAADWAAKAPVKGAAIEVRPIPDTFEENVELYKQAAEAT
jgi:hypothetical protein